MDSLSLIKSKVSYDELLKKLDFKSIDSSDNSIRCACGIHGGNNPTAFVVNKENGLWYCHTGGCGGGDIVKLVEKKFHIDFVSAIKWFSEEFDLDLSGLELKERTIESQNELDRFIKAIKSRRTKSFEEIEIPTGRNVSSYRKFSRETLSLHNVTFHDKIKILNKKKEEVELFKRILFPIQFDGKNVAFALRRTSSYQMPKWFNYPTSFQFGNILYNYDIAKKSEIICVVEGILDVLALEEIGMVAVATFGAHLTKEQYKLLIKTSADIILMYDGDEAGRIATANALSMLEHTANVYVVDFKEGDDAENVEREVLIEYIRNKRKHIST